MNKLLLLIFMSIVLLGCGEHEYKLSEYSDYYLPDSNKAKYAEFIQKTVAAASFHMSGGNYEDPEDVINAAKNIAMDLYGVETYNMLRDGYFVRFEKMTPRESLIYDSLLKVRTRNMNIGINR